MAARLIALAALAAIAGAAAPLAASATSLRQWMIYFQFDSTAYADGRKPGAAERVVQDFAEFARASNLSRIVVVGHTDRSGAEPYNTELSLLRAETVADELKRLGVEPGIISVQAKGETEPQVSTPDGVAEQLNRRAEIVWLK